MKKYLFSKILHVITKRSEEEKKEKKKRKYFIYRPNEAIKSNYH